MRGNSKFRDHPVVTSRKLNPERGPSNSRVHRGPLLGSALVTRHVRALRGATTVDEDTSEAMDAAVKELFSELFDRNDLRTENLISVWITATNDLHAKFPAKSAREFGLDDIPLMGAQELDVTGGLARCVRVMIHLETDRPRAELRHVYLKGAAALRTDLVT